MIQDPFFTIDGKQYEIKEVAAPPTPVDCVWGPWSAWTPTGDWSPCVNGTQSRTEQRTRTIETPASNGGLPCEGPTTETRSVSQACVVIPPDPGGMIVAHGNNFKHDYWLPSDNLDPAKLPTPEQAIPWTAKVNAAGALANHAGGVMRSFRSLPIYGNITPYGYTVPGVFDSLGKRVQNQLVSNFGTDMMNARNALKNWSKSDVTDASPGPFPFRAGPRGHLILSPYNTVYGHSSRFSDGTMSTNPHSPLFLALQADGLMQGLMRDGSCRHLMQLPIPDNSYTNDFAQWEANRIVFFYLDSVNGKVMKVDRTNTPWEVTTFAEGFGLLTSCKVIGQNLYLMERSTGNVWEVVIATGARRVITWMGAGFWLDYYSNGDLLVMAEDSRMIRVTPESGVQTVVNSSSMGNRGWVQCSVDRHGTCGLVDTVYWVTFTGNSNSHVQRILPDGTKLPYIAHGSGNMSAGESKWVAEAHGHYLWTVAVHPDEGLIYFNGAWSGQPGVLGVAHENDPFPAPYPYKDVFQYESGVGVNMLMWGGPQRLLGQVPSFVCQIGAYGASATGITFDYLTSLGYEGLRNWLNSGGAGSVPRNMTNAEVYFPMAYIMANSQQHLVQGRKLIDDLRAFMGVV